MPIDVEWRINWTLSTVADGIHVAGLDLVVNESKTIVLTAKYKMKNIQIALQGKVINLSHSMKYFDLILDKVETSISI